MARGRMISKALSTSQRFAMLFERAGDLGEFAQSLYPLLVAHADDFGRQAGDLFTIKHKVHPASPRTLTDFQRAVTALHNVGLVVWYDNPTGGKCLQVVQFDKHQSGLHKRVHSEFPEYAGIPGNLPEVPGSSVLTELNRTELNRTELKGTEGKGTEQRKVRAARVSPTPDGFDAFWKVYPKRIKRTEAEQAWRKLNPDAVLRQVISAALSWQVNQRDWVEQGRRFMPNAEAYLNNKRWEDEPSRQVNPLTANDDVWATVDDLFEAKKGGAH